jgi:diguanylate cyclase (GGDEF)-like protein
MPSGMPEPTRPDDARLLAAIKQLPGTATLLLDQSFTISWMSASSVDVWGYEPHELVGHGALEFVHPDDADSIATDLLRIADNAESDLAASRLDGGGAQLEMRMRGRHGWVPTSVAAHLMFAVDGVESLILFAWRSRRGAELELAIEAIGRSEPLENVLQCLVRYLDANAGDIRSVNRIVTWQGDPPMVVTGDGVIEGDVFSSPDVIAFARTVLVREEFSVDSGLPADIAWVGREHGDRTTLLVEPIFEPVETKPSGALLVWDIASVPFHRLQLLPAAMRLAGVAMSVHQTTSELAARATRDPLTGLLNRDGFEDAVEVVDRRTCAVLVVDLDDFKPVNDRFGHHTGDEVLVEAARRIAAAVREGDVVARLGGDEFAAILTGASDLEGAEHVAQRIVESMRAPIGPASAPVRIGCSVGVALRRADEPFASSIRRADAAMYDAKEAGKSRVGVAADGETRSSR